jgi:opacity protein-like surface antigen
LKKLIVTAALIALGASSAIAQRTTRVDGYVRKDGTYVAPHVRTTPNTTTSDNWSTRGNVNPYNGKEGTVDPYQPKAPSWSSKRSY